MRERDSRVFVMLALLSFSLSRRKCLSSVLTRLLGHLDRAKKFSFRFHLSKNN